jgi:plasmid stabilization system protein ParE
VRQVRWTTEASDQLVAALKRIQEDNPTAALNVAQTVIDRIEQPATFPGLGRSGEVKGTRELLSPPYVVVYRYTDEMVESCTSGTVRRTGAERRRKGMFSQPSAPER